MLLDRYNEALDALIANKRSTGRAKDAADAAALEKIAERRNR